MRITQLKSVTALRAMEDFQSGQPCRFRALFTTITDDPTDIHLGIYDGGELVSVLTLQPRAKGVYEVHLALKRGVGVVKLLPAFFSIKAQLFGELGVKEISGWVPTLHRGIQKLAERVGFFWNGVTLLQMKNQRLVEWKQLVLRIDNG